MAKTDVGAPELNQSEAAANAGRDVESLVGLVFTRLSDAGIFRRASIELEIATDGNTGSSRVTLKVSNDAVPANVARISGSDDPGSAQPEFNSEGHHVVAFIAARDLTQNSPATMTAVSALLQAVDRDLREAATFPDDIRDEQPQTKPFHFIDIPFTDGGPVNPALPDPPHVLSRIEEFSQFLRGRGGAQERADALCWLIHLFGDIHQPLHCIEHISDLHPGGDRGGNSFQLRGPKRNLHALWDSAVNVTQNIDEEGLADDILQAHPRTSLAQELAVTDPEEWARASFKLAKMHAYSLEENPQHPPTPSVAYKKNMEKIGRRQAALAGYRLADRLKSVLE
jgi:hypothetical protein